MNLLAVGRTAVLAEVESVEAATALYLAARHAGISATEIVPAARTVLFDGIDEAGRAWLGRFEEADGWPDAEVSLPTGDVVTVPVIYDGPDLAETASLLAMTVEGLVDLHCTTAFTVAFCGFAPGFAYCAGWTLDVPRLATPRPRVEPGSVGLAGEFTGIYPSASPGGWRLIGRTDAVIWDPAGQRPALLAPGTSVRFEAR